MHTEGKNGKAPRALETKLAPEYISTLQGLKNPRHWQQSTDGYFKRYLGNTKNVESRPQIYAVINLIAEALRKGVIELDEERMSEIDGAQRHGIDAPTKTIVSVDTNGQYMLKLTADQMQALGLPTDVKRGTPVSR